MSRLWQNRARTINERGRMFAADGRLTGADLREIVSRDGSRCVYCSKTLDYNTAQPSGKGDATFDHIVRLCDGGSNTFANVVCSCRTCNKLNNKASLDDPEGEAVRRLRFFLARIPGAARAAA